MDDLELIEKISPTNQEVNAYFGFKDIKINYDKSYIFPTTKLLPNGDTYNAWEKTSGALDSSGNYIGLVYWSKGKSNELIKIPVAEKQRIPDNEIWERFDSHGTELYYCEDEHLIRKEMTGSFSSTIVSENCASPGIVDYDPTNNLIAYPVGKHLIEIISGETDEVVFQLRGFTKNITKLEFSKDGNWIVLVTYLPSSTPSIMNFNEVMLFNLDHETGEAIATPLDIKNPVYQDYVLNLEISHAGNFMAAGILSLDSKVSNRIKIWDFDGQYGSKVRSIYVDHPDIIALSPDATMVGVASDRSLTVKIFSIESSELIAEFQNPRDANIEDVMFSRDGKSLYIVIGGAISVWGVQ